jgi:hypothetical protein
MPIRPIQFSFGLIYLPSSAQVYWGAKRKKYDFPAHIKKCDFSCKDLTVQEKSEKKLHGFADRP